MNKEKYLPLGSVVLLKGATHRLMIIGFCFVVKADDNRQYDYVGIFYPEGYVGVDNIFCFDHDDIETISCEGFSDDTEKKFRSKLAETIRQISTDDKGHHISPEKFDELMKKDIDYE